MHKPYPLRRGGSDAAVWKTAIGFIAYDFDGGVKQLMFAVPGLGPGEAGAICAQLDFLRTDLDGGLRIEAGQVDDPHDNRVANSTLAWSGVTVLFTDVLAAGAGDIRAAGAGATLEIIDENTRGIRLRTDVHSRFSKHDSVFVSYGGPDEPIADRINVALRGNGVTTWFFKDNALPGQKLHRMMSDGVQDHDRVLLICSKSSLVRSGVLNEIERVLEREAREGAADILVPVRVDDFVLSDWAPERRDVADQVRSRVIGDFGGVEADPEKFDRELAKVLRALARAGKK